MKFRKCFGWICILGANVSALSAGRLTLTGSYTTDTGGYADFFEANQPAIEAGLAPRWGAEFIYQLSEYWELTTGYQLGHAQEEEVTVSHFLGVGVNFIF